MSSFQVKTTVQKGRGLFATVPIAEGTVLFEETPLVSSQFCWNAAYGYLACEYCMKPLETAESNVQRLANDFTINLPYLECCPIQNHLDEHVRCPDCNERYCSRRCFNNALQQYHKVLCLGTERNNEQHPVNKLIEYWKKTHYPPETSSITLIIKIIGMFKQCDNVAELRNKFTDFISESANKDLSIFHKMLGENFTEQIDQLYQLTCKAFDVDTNERLQWLTPSGFHALLALIGTNGQGIGTSSFAEWVRNVTDLENLKEENRESLDNLIDTLYKKLDEVAGCFLNNEGSALYSLQSKINHSCNPNAECRFPHSNNLLALTVTRDVQPGEEICISYLDECALERSRHSRQKILCENYLFQCQCEQCERQLNDPDETSEDEEENDDQMEDESD
ncbi:histone-lysine N-trimethyltransferase SMYD5 [Uranotaenia lowii]|uniref:histone-lysine N-trimethyltransferase SMYD5 n=1 Tax=Uranotaenia lowii TaxID=190385 RepID=UPI00247844D4|nr:histone-lysine N-trimethyltransferase SMYD5 [Uranotaenia lowii]